MSRMASDIMKLSKAKEEVYVRTLMRLILTKRASYQSLHLNAATCSDAALFSPLAGFSLGGR
jgi:hypothetical protein